MSIISTNVNENILLEFKNTIFHKSGLKHGDFRESLQEAIEDYIRKYFDSPSIVELEKLSEHKFQIKL